MKTKLVLACVVILALLTGCAGHDYTFTATVLDANETFLLVEPAEGSSELRSADKFSVMLNDAELLDADNNKTTVDKFAEGNKVEIVYNGIIAESYPAQIRAEKVKILE